MPHRQNAASTLPYREDLVMSSHSVSSAPSSIHSASTHDTSHNSSSGESLSSVSILESIGGRTRDRILDVDFKMPTVEHFLSEENAERDDGVLDIGLDCLDETIQSLLDTKTPMLPLRIRSKMNSIPIASTRAGVQIAGDRHVDDSWLETDCTPTLNSRTVRNKTERIDNQSTQQFVDPLSSIKTDQPREQIGQKLDTVDKAASLLKPNPSETGQKLAETGHTLESLADLDSIIARYRNLRGGAGDATAAKFSSNFDEDRNRNVNVDARLPSSEYCDVSTTLPAYTEMNSNGAGDGCSAQRLSLGSKFNLSGECGLDNEEFEDIRTNLINISLDDDLSTPVAHHLPSRGQSFLT